MRLSAEPALTLTLVFCFLVFVLTPALDGLGGQARCGWHRLQGTIYPRIDATKKENECQLVRKYDEQVDDHINTSGLFIFSYILVEI